MEKIVLVKAKIRVSKIDHFLELAETMAVKSNTEDGCLMYQVFRSTDSDNEFLFYEKYKDDRAIEFHHSSDHFKYFMSEVEPLLLEEPEIKIR